LLRIHGAVLSTIKLQSPAFTETLSMCTMKEWKRIRKYRDRKYFIMEVATRSQDLLALLGKIAMKWTWIFHESIGNY